MSNDRRDSGGTPDELRGISRRALLKGTASAALAAAAGAVGLNAQSSGLTKEGAVIPFRKPLGALDYLDPKQYIKNMEIISFLPDVAISSGEPLMALYAKGAQRMLPGGGGWVDISDPKKPVVIKTPSRTGGAVVYNTKLKKWIMMSSAAPPLTNGTPEHPNGRYDPELFKNYQGYKGLRGIRTWDITDPTKPVLLQEYSTGATGTGTHMNFYDGGKYAYLECGWDETLRMENSQRAYSNGLMIVDLSDPANVKEVAKWWAPGQKYGEEAEFKKYRFADDHMAWTGNHGAMIAPKRPEDGGTIGYTGFGAFGMYVMDLTDITKPKPHGKFLYEFETRGSIPYHTIYPLIPDPAHPKLNGLVLGVPETIHESCREEYKTVYVIDVRDPKNPKLVSLFPRPQAPPDAPYPDFCMARGRFGPHNCQCWIAPGTSRSHLWASAWFVAGLRLWDLIDPTSPKEVAWFVPKRDGDIEKYETWWRGTSEGAFVEWDRNLIWLGTHHGTYCLSSSALGKPVLEPRKIDRWTIAHANVGWDDATPRSVYFGRSLSQLLG